MDHERQATIRKLVADENVKHIQLWFTDILGNLKMVEVPDRQLDSVIESGRRLRRLLHHRLRRDRGVRHRRHARLGHLQGAALGAGPRETAFVFCDVLDRDYKPFEGDPRWVLRRQLERAQRHGPRLLRRPRARVLLLQGRRRRPSSSTRAATSTCCPPTWATTCASRPCAPSTGSASPWRPRTTRSPPRSTRSTRTTTRP